MIKPKVYHATITADTPYTFEFDVSGSFFYVKNFTDSMLTASFGTEIDNNSYNLIPKQSCIPLASSFVSKPETETDRITVLSESSGIVEIQIMEY
jgi:hypothetical protein